LPLNRKITRVENPEEGVAYIFGKIQDKIARGGPLFGFYYIFYALDFLAEIKQKIYKMLKTGEMVRASNDRYFIESSKKINLSKLF